MKIRNIIITSLFEDKEDVELYDSLLEEGISFPLTPFIAYTAFKKKIFNKFNKENKFVEIPKDNVEKVKDSLRQLKANGLIEKEKARAKLGVASGDDENATVYKMTPEQMEVLSDIYIKYGKEIVKEINNFRVNVLAPYQLIKRIVKKSKSVTSKDVLGMTKEEFDSYYESGKRKILKAGEYFGKSKELENKIRDYEERMNTLEKEKEKLKKGKKLSPSLLEKLYSEYKVGEKNFGSYSIGDLRKTANEFLRNLSTLRSYGTDSQDEKMTPEDVLELAKRQKSIILGKGVRKKEEEDKEKKKNDEEEVSFSTAFNNYLLRKEIQNNVRRKGENIYKRIYLKIIDDEIEENKKKKNELMKYYIESKSKLGLNDKEKLIWKKRPGSTAEYSGDLNDYIQAIKPEDFKEPIYIERPEELIDAEKEIENEIKRFERKLETIMDKEDVEKLKKYRLINNLISIKELKDPDTLFKSPEELKAIEAQKLASTVFVDEDDLINKINEVKTKHFDEKEDLEKAKTELRALAQKLRKQGDAELIKKHAEDFRVALTRKNLQPSATIVLPKEEPEEETVTLDKIKTLLSLINERQYSTKEEIEADEKNLADLIGKFKEQNENAVFELEKISDELSKVKNKIDLAKETV